MIVEMICIEGDDEMAEVTAAVLVGCGGEDVLWNLLLGSSAQQHKLQWIACGPGTQSHDLAIESLAVDKVADAKVIRCLCSEAQIPTTMDPQRVHSKGRRGGPGSITDRTQHVQRTPCSLCHASLRVEYGAVWLWSMSRLSQSVTGRFGRDSISGISTSAL